MADDIFIDRFSRNDQWASRQQIESHLATLADALAEKRALNRVIAFRHRL
jgi:hypothetical protein